MSNMSTTWHNMLAYLCHPSDVTSLGRHK